MRDGALVDPSQVLADVIAPQVLDRSTASPFGIGDLPC